MTPHPITTASARPEVRLWLGLLSVLGGQWRTVWHTVLAGLVQQLAVVGAGITAAHLLGAAVVEPSAAPRLLVSHWGWLVGFTVLSGFATWWEMYVAHDLAYRVLATLRGTVFTALTRLLPPRLRQRSNADIAATAMGDAEMLEWFYAHVVAQGVVTLVSVGTLWGVTAWIAPPLLWISVPAVIAILSVPWMMKRVADRQGATSRLLTGALHSGLVELVEGMPELAGTGAVDRAVSTLQARHDQLAAHDRRVAYRIGTEHALSMAVLALAGVASLLMVTRLVTADALPAALAPVVLTLSGATLATPLMVAGVLVRAGTLRVAGTRLLDIVEAPDLTPSPASPIEVPPRPALGFDDVHFAYDPAIPVLRGVSFRVAPGETVALVGTSGAGKSTCVTLAQRFFDPDSGSITVGGVDLRDIAEADLPAAVTVVPQDVQLFAGSLAMNVRLARPAATTAEVCECLELVGLEEWYQSHPCGVEVPVGDRGVSLSGGQRTRVGLARALLSRAPVIILDEVVAGLDATLELEITRRVAHARPDAALLVVAHRESAMRRADRIVVVEDGRVVQSGTPGELMSGPGPLRSLIGEVPSRADVGE